MSTKKTVAIVDGKALNAPKTPEKQSSPPAEVKLDDKLVTAFLSDTNIYDLWKKLADGGGMKKTHGVEDAAHLEKIIHKAAADLREAYRKESINKHSSEPIPKKPHPKPISKKKRNGKGNGKKKKFEGVTFKAPRKKKPKWKKKGDLLYHCVPGHYGANQ